jgi:hypothetical protein
MAVFWVVAPCRLVWVYQHFRGLCCLHHQGDDGASTDLWNVSKLIPVYPALQHGRQPSPHYILDTVTTLVTVIKYRVFHLKHNPNYDNICNLWWHKYNKKNEIVFHMSTLSTVKHVNTSYTPKFCYLSVYCHLIWYFLVKIHTARCFVNSSIQFRWKVMFMNEHTFCLWIRFFAPAQLFHNWCEQWPIHQVNLLPISFLYCIMWLFSGYSLNGTTCITQTQMRL